MKNYLLTLITGALFSLNGHCVWEHSMAMVKWKKAEKVEESLMSRGMTREAWEDVNNAISRQTGLVKPIVSPEYVVYRLYGVDALVSSAVYGEKYAELDAAVPVNSGTAENPWLHLVQPQSKEEDNCLSLTRKNGVVSGCGDIWQGGVSDTEVACLDGKLYVKCHLECVEKIHNRKLDYVVGKCPAVDAEPTVNASIEGNE